MVALAFCGNECLCITIMATYMHRCGALQRMRPASLALLDSVVRAAIPCGTVSQSPPMHQCFIGAECSPRILQRNSPGTSHRKRRGCGQQGP